MYAVFIDKANDQDRKGSGQLRIHSANTVQVYISVERNRQKERETEIERNRQRERQRDKKRLKYGNRQRETMRKSQKETKRI